MALFVADLAFPAGHERRIATVAVLVASAIAAILALVPGRSALARSRVEVAGDLPAVAEH